MTALVKLIVGLQTISDYLDNLCDRSTSLDTRDYRTLHYAMLDAVMPGDLLPASRGKYYYREHPCRDDGGYLLSLVQMCRRQLDRLPGYDVVAPWVWRFVRLYADLQVLKHAPKQQRELLLQQWYIRHRHLAAGVDWHEFAAAAGSTLAVFALFGLASNGRPDPALVMRLLHAYFPWVCGLHILLDYWIDQEEDRLGDDLNFTSFYRSLETTSGRLHGLLREALRRVTSLPDRSLHETIVQGLPGLYLSDPKAISLGLKPFIGSFLGTAGFAGRVTYLVCRLRRRLSNRPELQRPPLVPRV